MPPGELRADLERFIRQSGIPVRDLVILPARKGRIANAIVSGILPGCRLVFLTDWLLEQLSPREVRCVVAHELGHLRHRHLWGYSLWGWP